MAACDPKQLHGQIRKGAFERLYYIYGADLVQVQQLTAALFKKATGGNLELSLTQFDGQKLEIKELVDASRQFSMFSNYNCIQVHDLDANRLREDQLKQLLELLPEIGDATILVFDVTGFDPKAGKKTPQGKNKKLIDCIAKYGVVCEAVQRTPAVLARELSGLAEKRGCILPPDSAEELVKLCMGNTLILRSELEKLCAIAKRYGKWIISDEIHCDIVSKGIVHHMLETVCPQYKEQIITCVAPTKTFNIAGLECSHVIIHNEEYKKRWKEVVVDQMCISAPNCFALSAAMAAYGESDEWRRQMNDKIDENAQLAKAFFARELPLAKVTPREGTYLLWVDLSAYEPDAKRLEKRMREQARVHLNEGVMFGEEGKCFERINIACPSSLLLEALQRIAAELKR